MDQEINQLSEEQKVSILAQELKGSEIINLAGEIRQKIEAGARIFNFTIGDFDPEIFPIPEKFREEIVAAYNRGETNYPPSNGMGSLLKALAESTRAELGLDYKPEEFLVAGGARPLIYAAYQAILDPDEAAVFPVPSWNNNHYTTLTRGKLVEVETSPENNFMPSASDLADHISEAGLIALCSPLNPTGTVFSREKLAGICEMVLEENRRRENKHKPLYILYDQIYRQLCFGNVEHVDPVSLYPELRPYVIYIDGLSKSFAATGVRVGWAFGPSSVISKMKSILGHIGAWSPKPEQVATAKFIANTKETTAFLSSFKERLHSRLQKFHDGFNELKAQGYPVESIPPQAAIYLTVRVDLAGKSTKDGKRLEKTSDITAYLLDEAGIALVPFKAFGADPESRWFRLSVGTARSEEIELVLKNLKEAIDKLA